MFSFTLILPVSHIQTSNWWQTYSVMHIILHTSMYYSTDDYYSLKLEENYCLICGFNTICWYISTRYFSTTWLRRQGGLIFVGLVIRASKNSVKLRAAAWCENKHIRFVCIGRCFLTSGNILPTVKRWRSRRRWKVPRFVWQDSVNKSICFQVRHH